MTRSHDAKTDHVDGTIRETNAPLSVSDIQGMLSRSRKGMVIQSASNCAIVLREDPVLKGHIFKDELSERICTM